MAKPYALNIYFGLPGSGKTTYASYLAKKDLKKGVSVWSNVPITGCFKIEPKDDIGKFNITNGRLIIDEAGIEYNNRDFKNFSQESTYFYKYHRHYQLNVDIFSQGYDDMDKKLRTLASGMYLIKKSIIPFFICKKKISKRVGIDTNTKQVIDEYFFAPFGTRWIFTPPLWKMFNTYSRKTLPDKPWTSW